MALRCALRIYVLNYLRNSLNASPGIQPQLAVRNHRLPGGDTFFDDDFVAAGGGDADAHRSRFSTAPPSFATQTI